MCTSFEEFFDPPQSKLKNLVDAMSQPKESLEALRKEFKKSINNYFEQRPPFPTGGKEINDDIYTYVKLISYCLEAGDTGILKRWGIVEVGKNPQKMLVSNNFSLYCTICQKGREQQSKTSLEEDCWTMLVEFFLSLSLNERLPLVNPYPSHF
jgi:hypothetical protein